MKAKKSLLPDILCFSRSPSSVSPLTLTLFLSSLWISPLSVSPLVPHLTSLQDGQGGRIRLGQRWEVSLLACYLSFFLFFFFFSFVHFQLQIEFLKCHTLFCLGAVLSFKLLGIRTDGGLYLPGTSWMINQKQLAGERLQLSGHEVRVYQHWPQTVIASVSHWQWVILGTRRLVGLIGNLVWVLLALCHCCP